MRGQGTTPAAAAARSNGCGKTAAPCASTRPFPRAHPEAVALLPQQVEHGVAQRQDGRVVVRPNSRQLVLDCAPEERRAHRHPANALHLQMRRTGTGGVLDSKLNRLGEALKMRQLVAALLDQVPAPGA